MMFGTLLKGISYHRIIIRYYQCFAQYPKRPLGSVQEKVRQEVDPLD